MPKRPQISTRILLVCAAIAVGTGLFSAAAGYVTVPVLATAPILYGVVLTAHLVPGIVAQTVLQERWVALITHLLAALVGLVVSPQWLFQYLLAVAVMGGTQEAWAAIGKYRKWSMGWLLCGGVILGALLGLTAGLGIGIKKFGLPVAILTIGIYVVGGALWTLAGMLIGRAMRKAGLARTARS